MSAEPTNDDVAVTTVTADVQRPRSQKTGRTRYLRLFPERIDFLLARLVDAQIAAYLRILVEYVVRDGDLPDDDRKLAKIARLSPRAWSELRHTLASLGVAHADDGRWIDADQDASLKLQRERGERQRVRALQRWHPKVVVS